jgi:hypothetical protein
LLLSYSKNQIWSFFQKEYQILTSTITKLRLDVTNVELFYVENVLLLRQEYTKKMFLAVYIVRGNFQMLDCKQP